MVKMNTIREVHIELLEADVHYSVVTAARLMMKGWTHSSALRFLLERYLTISFSNKYINAQILGDVLRYLSNQYYILIL